MDVPSHSSAKVYTKHSDSRSGDIDDVYAIPAVAEWMADPATSNEIAQ